MPLAYGLVSITYHLKTCSSLTAHLIKSFLIGAQIGIDDKGTRCENGPMGVVLPCVWMIWLNPLNSQQCRISSYKNVSEASREMRVQLQLTLLITLTYLFSN